MRQNSLINIAAIISVLWFALSGLYSFGQNVQRQNNTVDKSRRLDVKVDPTTLAMNFEIPLGAYPGRAGNSVPQSLRYNSKVWKMEYGGYYRGGSCCAPSFTANPQGLPDENNYSWVNVTFADGGFGGWSVNSVFAGYGMYDARPTYDGFGYPADINDNPDADYFVDRQRVILPDGSTHELRRDDTVRADPLSTPSYPLTYYSVDSSGLKLVRTSATNATLYLPNGSRYVWTSSGTEFIDANGNKTVLGSTITDTLGRQITPLFLSGSVGDQTYALPGVGTATRTHTLRWRLMKNTSTGESVLSNPSQSLKTLGDHYSTGAAPQVDPLFGSSGASRVTPPSTFNPVLLGEVEMPDGGKYQFRYNIYGEIDKIIYPTGAYERFEYAQIDNIDPLNDPYAQTNRGVIKRWVSENGTGSDEILMQYSADSGTQYWTRVTNPDGSYVDRIIQKGRGPAELLYGFDLASTGMILEERVYNTAGQMISRTLNSYVTQGSQGGHSSATRDARLEKTVSIVIEPSQSDALMSMRTLEYDSHTDHNFFAHLNVKRMKEYGFVTVARTTAQNVSNPISTFAAYFNSQTPVKVSETDYSYDDNYKARGILGRVVETRIVNPSNPTDVWAKSQFVYDEATYFDNNYTATNWENPNSSLRGNVTTTRTWNTNTSTWIESHTMFDNFGNVRKVWETSGDTTRFVETEYSSSNYAYPIKTKAPAPDPGGVYGTNEGSEITRVFDSNTGLITSVTDARNQTATTEYDVLLRPIRITPPYGGAISETIYNDTPGNSWVKSRQQIDATNWSESTTYFDRLGRAKKSVHEDSQGDVVAEVRYDQYGRVEKTSNPYRIDASGNPTETIYWSKVRYDESNRVVETYAPAPDGQTGNSLGTVQFGISSLTDLVGTYTVALDASGRKSRAITGTYGLMRVDEATAKSGTVDQDLGSLSNPSQPTSYTYNTKGELTKITQGSQNRFFMYDSFGRLIRIRQPEQTPNAHLATSGNPENNSWTAGYTYDVFGNVVNVTDAKNITITNYYDKASRTTKRTYSDGTPQVEYFYDGKGLPSAPQFSKGSLTKVTSSVSEDRFTEFDNHGRLLASQQITDGQTYGFGYKYNLSGGLTEQTYPSGRIVRSFLDADGGLSAVTSKAGNGMTKRVISDFDYTASGSVKKVKLGNGLWETSQVSHLNQLTQIGLGTTHTNNSIFKIDYEYGELNSDGTTVDTAKNIGNIAKTTTTIPTTSFVQTFKYDEINRLTEAVEKTGSTQNWKQTFGYDRYGNRTSRYQIVGSTVLAINNITQPTIDQANNRFTTGQGYIYDYSGNLIQDAEGRSFTFNGDDKQTEVRNTATSAVVGQYAYDGSGARVKKYIPSTGETTIFVYDAGGALAAEYSTVAPPPTPTTSYLTTDHLGSPRVITDKAGAVTARRDFMPFGEDLSAGVGPRTESLKYSYTGSDNIRKRFTGYEKDDETGLDFAQARMYQNKHGRFTAVDPLLASASPGDPQSFNRYIYTGNDPINRTDPSGLTWCRNADGHTQWQGKVGSKCSSGYDPIDGQTRPLRRGTVNATNGVAKAGDEVRFNRNGTATIVTSAASAPSAAAKVRADEAAASTSPASDISAHSIVPSPMMPAPPCHPDIPCDTSMEPPQSLDTSQNGDLTAVARIKDLADIISFVPGANIAGVAIKTVILVNQGEGREALGELPNFLPGLKLLRRADKVLDIVKTGGRLGGSATRNQISEIASKLEARGYTITGGGQRGLKEEYLRPLLGGRRGGSYVDITATHPKYGTLRINTVSTLKNGTTATALERRNAARIRKQIGSREHLLLIPKR